MRKLLVWNVVFALRAAPQEFRFPSIGVHSGILTIEGGDRIAGRWDRPDLPFLTSATYQENRESSIATLRYLHGPVGGIFAGPRRHQGLIGATHISSSR